MTVYTSDEPRCANTGIRIKKLRFLLFILGIVVMVLKVEIYIRTNKQHVICKQLILSENISVAMHFSIPLHYSNIANITIVKSTDNTSETAVLDEIPGFYICKTMPALDMCIAAGNCSVVHGRFLTELQYRNLAMLLHELIRC